MKRNGRAAEEEKAREITKKKKKIVKMKITPKACTHRSNLLL